MFLPLGALYSAAVAALKQHTRPAWLQACDVELLSVGGFSPLEGFMNEDAYRSVLKDMRCGRNRAEARAGGRG